MQAAINSIAAHATEKIDGYQNLSLPRNSGWTCAYEGSVKDVRGITLLDAHGVVQDLRADRWAKSAMTMLDARSACHCGGVNEASRAPAHVKKIEF